MDDFEYSDKELETDSQFYYLKIASYFIKLELGPSEHLLFKRLFILDIVKFWGGLFQRKPSKVDFSIIVDFRMEKVKLVEKDKENYILGWRWDYSRKRVIMSAIQSVWVLQLAIKHILFYLIQDKGFIIHGSSVMDSSGCLHIFSTHSGGGKSTTSDWMVEKGLTKATDDTVVVIKEKDKWTCYSSGMVEKSLLPFYFRTNNYRYYAIQKSKSLEKVVPQFAVKLKSVMRQVRSLDVTMSESTYKMVIDFVMTSPIYVLKLPLRPDNILEVINEA